MILEVHVANVRDSEALLIASSIMSLLKAWEATKIYFTWTHGEQEYVADLEAGTMLCRSDPFIRITGYNGKCVTDENGRYVGPECSTQVLKGLIEKATGLPVIM